jgi:hypothetical protein
MKFREDINIMAELTKRNVRITIDSKGQYTLEAGEGFSGASCLEKTKNLEVALGGTAIDEGKTGSYYDGDGDSPVTINLD